MKKKTMRIGELAKFADIETSTIRYWEERGLIKSIRNESSGYRFYEKNEVRKTIIISLLRKSVRYLDKIKIMVDGMNDKSRSSIRKHYTVTNRELDIHLEKQLESISFYRNYCEKVRQC